MHISLFFYMLRAMLTTTVLYLAVIQFHGDTTQRYPEGHGQSEMPPDFHDVIIHLL